MVVWWCQETEFEIFENSATFPEFLKPESEIRSKYRRNEQRAIRNSQPLKSSLWLQIWKYIFLHARDYTVWDESK